MDKFDWSQLNNMQVGRYAEYFTKMELTLHGFEVYTSEVDDRCVDFVVRRDGGRFYDVQVKSVRESHYVFVPKDKFPIAPNRLLAVVILRQREAPELYLVPMTAYLSPNRLLVSKDYRGKKSKPEWGVNLSSKNKPLLNQYRLDLVLPALL